MVHHTLMALRVGYYWPTMIEDAKKFVKKCDKCHCDADVHLAPSIPHYGSRILHQVGGSEAVSKDYC